MIPLKERDASGEGGELGMSEPMYSFQKKVLSFP
jgi:hypothetical protein